MPQYRLVSFNVCPFVQRSAIALHEKGVEFDITFIDLANKPDWFLKLSPLGKVPLLEITDGDQVDVLFESAAILEYIDEVTSPRLHPEDPVERARHRALIQIGSGLAAPGWLMYTVATEEQSRAQVAKARKILQIFEDRIGEGPFWGGERFTQVDASMTPFLQRMSWCEDIEPSLNIFDGLPKVAAWTKTLLARPAVKASLLPDIDTIFRDYVASPHGSDGHTSWLATRL